MAIADYFDDCLRQQVDPEMLERQQLANEDREKTEQRLLAQGLAWFREEWENLKTIIRWVDGELIWDVGKRLPLLIDSFSMREGHRAEQEVLYTIGLRAALATQDRQAEANTLKAIGDVQQFLKQSPAALENYNQAMLIYRSVGARLGEANTLKAIGILLSKQGNYRQAVPSVEAALAIYRKIGDRYSQAATLQNLAVLYQNTGRVKEGFVCGQESIQLFSDLGLRSRAMPPWVQSVVKFAKRTKLHLAACVIAGVLAFPLALTALILITAWRFSFGRFRR